VSDILKVPGHKRREQDKLIEIETELISSNGSLALWIYIGEGKSHSISSAGAIIGDAKVPMYFEMGHAECFKWFDFVRTQPCENGEYDQSN
jgi:hypothetical protein